LQSSSGLSLLCCGPLVAALIYLGFSQPHPIAYPPRSHWLNPLCDASPPPAPDPGAPQAMLVFQTKIIGDRQSASSRALHDDIAAAYRFARAHCMPFLLQRPDELFMQGRYREAFGAYRDHYFSKGGVPFNTANHQDAGALTAFKTGVDAAADGNYNRARAAFSATIAKYDAAQEAHFLLGQVLCATGGELEARMQWRAAVETYGITRSEKDALGPDPSWMSALRAYAGLGFCPYVPASRACRDPKSLVDRGELVSARMFTFNTKIEDEYKSGRLAAARSDIVWRTDTRQSIASSRWPIPQMSFSIRADIATRLPLIETSTSGPMARAASGRLPTTTSAPRPPSKMASSRRPTATTAQRSEICAMR